MENSAVIDARGSGAMEYSSGPPEADRAGSADRMNVNVKPQENNNVKKNPMDTQGDVVVQVNSLRK